MLHEEATMSMPPYELWLRGRDDIAKWMLSYGIGCVGSRLVPLGTACGGVPAFAQYRQGGDQPWAIVLLELEGARVANLAYFLDTQSLFPRFGLPEKLVAG
jgi:RNA polymerase sigma-70 factor, ECF subfamily